jgi:hypothetical protein
MRWEADTSEPSSIVGGYFLGFLGPSKTAPAGRPRP